MKALLALMEITMPDGPSGRGRPPMTTAFYAKALVNLLLDYRQHGSTARLVKGLEDLAARTADDGRKK